MLALCCHMRATITAKKEKTICFLVVLFRRVLIRGFMYNGIFSGIRSDKLMAKDCPMVKPLGNAINIY